MEEDETVCTEDDGCYDYEVRHGVLHRLQSSVFNLEMAVSEYARHFNRLDSILSKLDDSNAEDISKLSLKVALENYKVQESLKHYEGTTEVANKVGYNENEHDISQKTLERYCELEQDFKFMNFNAVEVLEKFSKDPRIKERKIKLPQDYTKSEIEKAIELEEAIMDSISASASE